MRHLIEDLHFDPNMNMNDSGQNPLYVAVILGNVPATEYLLTKTKADPNMGLPRLRALDMAEIAEHFKKPYGTPLVQLLATRRPRNAAAAAVVTRVGLRRVLRSGRRSVPTLLPSPRGRRAGDEGAPLSRVNGTATEKSPATG